MEALRHSEGVLPGPSWRASAAKHPPQGPHGTLHLRQSAVRRHGQQADRGNHWQDGLRLVSPRVGRPIPGGRPAQCWRVGGLRDNRGPRHTRDGQTHWVHVIKAPILDATGDGRIVGNFLGRHPGKEDRGEDCGGREQLPEHRRERGGRHFSDNSGRTVYRANKALARIYGFDTPEELIRSRTNIGRELYLKPNRRQEFVEALQRSDRVGWIREPGLPEGMEASSGFRKMRVPSAIPRPGPVLRRDGGGRHGAEACGGGAEP